ncbi:MAG: BamA/TamA family outer membrane protein [bacterium]|nr:BamA/TamA family outer membrane protein [bacterium]MCS7309755.1 BamA/TamA family outer membrane protein [Armatimonadota bacterium]
MWRALLVFLVLFGMSNAVMAQPPTVTAVRFEGSQPDGSTVLAADELLAVMKTQVGAPLNEQLLAQDAEAVQRLYEQRGYPLARVVGFEPQPDGTLVVKIAEGRIRAVRVTGNRRTRGSTILRNTQLRPGEIYSLPKMQRERERLGKLPFLREVQVAPEPADELGQVVVNISVKEMNTTQFAAAVGYTSRRGLLGFLEFSDTNLFGGGQEAQIQWQRGTFFYEGGPEEGEQRQAYLLQYTDPSLTDWGLIVGFTAYDLQSVLRPTFSETAVTIRTFERRKGYRLLLGKEWAERLRVFATLRSDEVNYDDAPSYLLSLGQKALNRGRVVAPGLRVQYDSRDDRFNPRKGIFTQGVWESAQSSWGGDFAFDRFTVDLRGYFPALREGAIALRALFGFASRNLPLSESFWLGGFDLRGYEFDQFRGDRMVLFSGELRLPLLEGVQGVAFVDVGDAWTRGNSVRLNAGAGIGLRFFSPFGAIRLDIAAGRQRVFTYVTLGQSF